MYVCLSVRSDYFMFIDIFFTVVTMVVCMRTGICVLCLLIMLLIFFTVVIMVVYVYPASVCLSYVIDVLHCCDYGCPVFLSRSISPSFSVSDSCCVCMLAFSFSGFCLFLSRSSVS